MDLLNLSAAAIKLGVTPQAVSLWVERGDMWGVKAEDPKGRERAVAVPRSEVARKRVELAGKRRRKRRSKRAA